MEGILILAPGLTCSPWSHVILYFSLFVTLERLETLHYIHMYVYPLLIIPKEGKRYHCRIPCLFLWSNAKLFVAESFRLSMYYYYVHINTSVCYPGRLSSIVFRPLHTCKVVLYLSLLILKMHYFGKLSCF